MAGKYLLLSGGPSPADTGHHEYLRLEFNSLFLHSSWGPPMPGNQPTQFIQATITLKLFQFGWGRIDFIEDGPGMNRIDTS